MGEWRRSHDLTVILLAFASGTTDVLSFFALIGTFTSAMTGNTALLGLEIGQGRFDAAVRALTALAGFMCGGALGTLPAEMADRRRAVIRILAMEAACLGLFAAIWLGLPDPGHSPAVYGLILLSAAGMGMQSVAARRINLAGIPTVVFTSTLTGIVMACTERAIGRAPFRFEAVRQVAVFFAYLGGAILAGAVAAHSLGTVVILPLVAVIGALVCEYGAPPR